MTKLSVLRGFIISGRTWINVLNSLLTGPLVEDGSKRKRMAKRIEDRQGDVPQPPIHYQVSDFTLSQFLLGRV